MNGRLTRAKDTLLSTPATLCPERARIYTRVYRDNEPLPVLRRRSLALKQTLQEMTIYIEAEELVVGNTASRPKAAAIFPEYAVGWLENELEQINLRAAEAYQARREVKEEVKHLLSYWKGKTLQEHAHALLSPELEELLATKIIKAEGNMTSGDGHVAVNLRRLLEEGIGGYLARVKAALAALKPTSFADLKKRQLYLAMQDGLDGLCSYCNRYADLAASQAASALPERALELTVVEQTCRAIAIMPPQGFREALQLCVFVQMALQIESNGHSVSLGRLDNYLGPFYDRDLEAGRIDRTTALELLCCTWIKLTSVRKVRSASHTRTSGGGPLYQNVTIGGVDGGGNDATNAMSFLILDSVGEMKLTQPNLTVRYHAGLGGEFMAKCLEVLAKGFGMPAFNNDQIIVPGLLRLGVSPTDARDYAAIGCVEVAVPGKWGYRTTGMSFLNLMRVLLVTLNDGCDPSTGKIFLAGTRSLNTFADFGALMQAWKTQVQYYARATVAIDVAVDTALEDLVPDVLCSALTDDCIATGKHLKQGGAVYDWVSGLQVGIANLGNSLAALKKLVFEDKVIGKQVLLDALASDFAGSQGELLRLRLLNGAPKFGNDDDEVDQLLVQAYGYFIDEIERLPNTRFGRGPVGGGYYPGTSSISSNVPSGSEVGATPDGRHAGTPLAEGCSPSSGTDLLGPTAVFQSVAKLPTARILGGVLLNQKLSPKSVENPADMLKLEALIRTFFDDLKGWHVQYNIVSRETLLAAQKDPEGYRDLVVRVAGYSAFFRDLARDTQDDIISRTEHRL